MKIMVIELTKMKEMVFYRMVYMIQILKYIIVVRIVVNGTIQLNFPLIDHSICCHTNPPTVNVSSGL